MMKNKNIPLDPNSEALWRGAGISKNVTDIRFFVIHRGSQLTEGNGAGISKNITDIHFFVTEGGSN